MLYQQGPKRNLSYFKWFTATHSTAQLTGTFWPLVCFLCTGFSQGATGIAILLAEPKMPKELADLRFAIIVCPSHSENTYTSCHCRRCSRTARVFEAVNNASQPYEAIHLLGIYTESILTTCLCSIRSLVQGLVNHPSWVSAAMNFRPWSYYVSFHVHQMPCALQK